MTKIGFLNERPRHSLFLKESQAEQIFDGVSKFLTSKKEYEDCFVPYKMNIFLYGLPGTGKTSLINAVASQFGLDVLIVPFSPYLTDDILVQALIKASELECGIVVLEDVDCLFAQNRKPGEQVSKLTLSGLLNCLDGILRASGLIIFLTANFTENIDAALLRTAR